MDIIGKTTINPVLFFSGKIAGYTTWILSLILAFHIDIVDKISIFENGIISMIIFVIGIIFIVFSLINLGSSTRLGLPTENTIFKTNGLYKYSRNPMYVGFNLLTIAAMVYSLNILIILLGIYSILVYHLIILGEEQFLETRFGFEYCNYKKKIRRYF